MAQQVLYAMEVDHCCGAAPFFVIVILSRHCASSLAYGCRHAVPVPLWCRKALGSCVVCHQHCIGGLEGDHRSPVCDVSPRRALRRR